MTTFLKISDGTELLNVDHIASFKIRYRRCNLDDDLEREHSIGYRIADSGATSILISGLTEDEAFDFLAALGKAITKATETGGVIDPHVIAEHLLPMRLPGPCAWSPTAKTWPFSAWDPALSPWPTRPGWP